MNLRKSKSKQPLKPNYAELEKLANAQGVKPFDFDEAVGEGAELWTKEEFSEFENWLKETRVSDTIRENSK
jgi:hypothetical protein